MVLWNNSFVLCDYASLSLVNKEADMLVARQEVYVGQPETEDSGKKKAESRESSQPRRKQDISQLQRKQDV